MGVYWVCVSVLGVCVCVQHAHQVTEQTIIAPTGSLGSCAASSTSSMAPIVSNFKNQEYMLKGNLRAAHLSWGWDRAFTGR